jgi:hypothetical protein
MYRKRLIVGVRLTVPYFSGSVPVLAQVLKAYGIRYVTVPTV